MYSNNNNIICNINLNLTQTRRGMGAVLHMGNIKGRATPRVVVGLETPLSGLDSRSERE